jgi:hypothetical protein
MPLRCIQCASLVCLQKQNKNYVHLKKGKNRTNAKLYVPYRTWTPRAGPAGLPWLGPFPQGKVVGRPFLSAISTAFRVNCLITIFGIISRYVTQNPVPVTVQCLSDSKMKKAGSNLTLQKGLSTYCT